ncbi:hypothetical protein GCM10023108_11590 [Saccharopolyspora hordei]
MPPRISNIRLRRDSFGIPTGGRMATAHAPGDDQQAGQTAAVFQVTDTLVMFNSTTPV